jgi:poly(3-hydroxybutyrate) depolymerase
MIQAQDKNNKRYASEVFNEVKTDSVKYGRNVNFRGQQQDLTADIYQPSGDTVNNRPVVIFMHGGAFSSGSRHDRYVTDFAKAFARRGYVVMALSYRLGVKNQFSPIDYGEAIYRAVQDAKTAIRFIRAEANRYGIDTSNIYIGGGSAGAIAALHTAYWRQDEVPAYIDTKKLGPLENTGGYEHHSSTVSGVINCWGALIDTAYIKKGDAPVVNVHGVNDPIVPYKTTGMGIFNLFGSYYINEKATSVGIHSDLLAFANTGHGLRWDDSAKWNSTLETISNFLYKMVKEHEVKAVQSEEKSSAHAEIHYNYPRDNSEQKSAA